MSYTGLIAFLPCGQRGMVNHENRLLSTVDELLTADTVEFADDHVRRGAGAAAYDTAGLTNAPVFSGTLSASQPWGAQLVTFKGTTIAYDKAIGSASEFFVSAPSASSTLNITVPAGGVAIGNIVVVTVGTRTDTSAGESPTSFFDSKGNTYSPAPASAFGDPTPEVGVFWKFLTYYSVLTVALVAGDTVSVGLARQPGANVVAIAVADAFSGTFASPALDQAANAQGTGTAVATATAALAQDSELLISAVFNAGTSTLTAASGFTKRTEATITTGSVYNSAIRISSRIESASATILRLYDWYSDVETTPAGTVVTTQGSTAVVGTGTTFTNHAPGDRIVVANETRIISSITDATNLVTTESWANTNTPAVAYKLRVGNRLVTATSGGNLFKEKPTTLTTGNLDAVTLKSGLSRIARGKFVSGGKEAAANNRKLFYLNGVDPAQVLSGDGTTTSNIATPPSDWAAAADENKQPLTGTIHALRLVAGGNLNDPHRVYFSDPDNHEDFTSAAAFNLRFHSHIGDRIYNLVSFQGVLFAWKYPRGIFYLDDTSLLTTDWNVRVKSEAVGCAPSPSAALPMDDDVIFMAADGSIHLLSAVSDLGGVRASDLTRALGLSKWLRENLNLTRLGQVESAWHSHKKVAYFAVPGVNSLSNNLLLKFDFGLVQRGGPPRFSYSTRDAPEGITIRRSVQGGPETPIIGESGFAYLLDQDTRNKNGAGYVTSFQTPHLDLSDLDRSFRWRRKNFDHLELIFDTSGASGTLATLVTVDGVARQILTFDPTQRRVKKKLNCGDGHTINVLHAMGGTDTDFKLLGMNLYFRPGNEDASR